jgi:hypothetical protein
MDNATGTARFFEPHKEASIPVEANVSAQMCTIKILSPSPNFAPDLKNL